MRHFRFSHTSTKTTGPPSSALGGLSLLTRTTVVVLWAWWTACTFRAVPHVAAREPFAALHVAVRGRCAVPHVAHSGLYAALHVVPRGQCAARRAVVHPVSYRTLVWLALERLVLERLAVPEPQHLTLLARWSAGPGRRLVREVKTRLDARLVFHSCWRPPKMDTPPHATAIRGC